jgi:hypothetical protein
VVLVSWLLGPQATTGTGVLLDAPPCADARTIRCRVPGRTQGRVLTRVATRVTSTFLIW